MKIYFLFLFLCILTSSSFSQETKISKKQVPSVVLKAFKVSYPAATIRGTNKESKHGMFYYEIESKDGKTKRDVLYTSAGEVSEIEEIIPADQLPDPVKTAVVNQYPKAKIKSVEKNTQGAEVKYEVLLQNGKKKFEVIYSPGGSTLSN
jgi:ABC-type uncharacterized transport system auxiliary subunit